LVALYQKSLKEGKQAGDKRYETHFNLSSEATPKESCSYETHFNLSSEATPKGELFQASPKTREQQVS